MAGGITSSTEFQGIGGHPGMLPREANGAPGVQGAGTRVTLDVAGKPTTVDVHGIKHDPISLRARALQKLAENGHAGAKAELPGAIEELRKNGGASQVKTLNYLKSRGSAEAEAALNRLPGRAGTAGATGVRGAGTLRAMGPLGIFSTILGAVADEKDAKDPAKVKAIADQIRRGELRFEMLPPFSPLTDKVREELNAGEMA